MSEPVNGPVVLIFLGALQLVGIRGGDPLNPEGWPRTPAAWTLHDPMALQLAPDANGQLAIMPVPLLVPELKVVGAHVLAWQVLEGRMEKIYLDARAHVRAGRVGLQLPPPAPGTRPR